MTSTPKLWKTGSHQQEDLSRRLGRLVGTAPKQLQQLGITVSAISDLHGQDAVQLSDNAARLEH